MLGLNRWNMNKFLFVCGARSEKGGHMFMLKIRRFNEDEGKLEFFFLKMEIFFTNLASLVRGETCWIYLEVRWSSKKAGV